MWLVSKENFHVKCDSRCSEQFICLLSNEYCLLNFCELHQEAIAGKCNVVCISEDSRNRKPSEEELKVADYVFCRVFDVGRCSLDKIGDTVGGLEGMCL